MKGDLWASRAQFLLPLIPLSPSISILWGCHQAPSLVFVSVLFVVGRSCRKTLQLPVPPSFFICPRGVINFIFPVNQYFWKSLCEFSGIYQFLASLLSYPPFWLAVLWTHGSAQGVSQLVVDKLPSSWVHPAEGPPCTPMIDLWATCSGPSCHRHRWPAQQAPRESLQAL